MDADRFKKPCSRCGKKTRRSKCSDCRRDQKRAALLANNTRLARKVERRRKAQGRGR